MPKFNLILGPKGKKVSLGGKAGSACEEFEDIEGGKLG